MQVDRLVEAKLLVSEKDRPTEWLLVEDSHKLDGKNQLVVRISVGGGSR